MFLLAWPLNESQADVDLVLIETTLLFLCYDAILMLISRNLHKKAMRFLSKQTQHQSHFHSEATKCTVVK